MAREDQTGAAYIRLLTTILARSRFLAANGPPTFGINRPTALATLNAAAETALR